MGEASASTAFVGAALAAIVVEAKASPTKSSLSIRHKKANGSIARVELHNTDTGFIHNHLTA